MEVTPKQMYSLVMNRLNELARAINSTTSIKRRRSLEDMIKHNEKWKFHLEDWFGNVKGALV
ncbi:hypothetical protein [Flavobacterium alkalisoli]|uniref:hypothetical protein n=1 Tax=Flavobacterium alkalisoli TaxID=2602769 RepID=UPI003A90ED79